MALPSTTFPKFDDSVHAFSRPDGSTEGHDEDHGRIIALPQNVQFYGVKGNGSDDTARMQDALDDVLDPSSPRFAKTLVLPWTSRYYAFGALDWHQADRVGASDRWQRIEIHGKLRPQATIEIPARRFSIEGFGGAVHTNFSSYPMAEIDCSDLGTNAAISLAPAATSIVLKGLHINKTLGIGIEVQRTASLHVDEVYMRGVHIVQAVGANAACFVTQAGASVPGFGYHFSHCAFALDTAVNTHKAVELLGAVSGAEFVDQCYFEGAGVLIQGAAAASPATGFVFRDSLAENLAHPFLNIDSSLSEISGIHLQNMQMADNTFSPSSLIHNTGTATYLVSVENGGQYDRILDASSDPINGLSHWASSGTTGATVGQTTGYRTYDRFGRVTIAAPFLLGSATAVTSGNPNAGTNNFFSMNHASPTTVDRLDNGAAGQVVHMLFTNGNVTMAHGTNIKLAGGVNVAMTANDVMTVIYNGTTWYEVSRSVNG